MTPLAKESLTNADLCSKKEANSGQYATADAINLFDFSSCLAKLPGDRCVLLRYAGEGIAQYAKGSAAGDVYEMNNGYLRMRAALLALGDFSVSSNTKQDIPLNALANYRQAMYLALQYSPAAIAPVEVTMPNTFGSTTPAEGLEQAYPANPFSRAREYRRGVDPMEDAKVLNPKHRAAGFYGLLALSALSAIGSFWLSVAPPILKSDHIEQEIVASLARGESYRGAAPCRLGQSALIVL